MNEPLDDLPLTARERALVDAASGFARDVLAPNAAAWERDRRPLPRDAIRAYAALGLAGLTVPAPLGGQGASYFCKLRVAEVMARACFAATFALNNAQGSAARLVADGTADQVARHLPGLLAGDLVCAPALTEPGAGSDASAMATVAVKQPGGWRLDGVKAWVTNGAHADLLMLYAQTEPGTGARGIAGFLVDLHAPGVRRIRLHQPIGGSAIGAAEVAFDGVTLPDAALMSPPGTAFKRIMTSITAARIHVAAMVNAVVADCLDRAVDHAGTRVAFGRTLLEHQGLRWSLADVATRLEASRLLTYRAAGLIQRGREATLEAAQAKAFAADMAGPAVSACMQAMGAVGLEEDQPFGRHLMAARIAAYVDGTTEMQRDRIGAMLPQRYGTRVA